MLTHVKPTQLGCYDALEELPCFRERASWHGSFMVS